MLDSDGQSSKAKSFFIIIIVVITVMLHGLRNTLEQPCIIVVIIL